MEIPTNNELSIMLQNLQEKMDEKHEDIMNVLSEIRTDGKETKAEVKYTNGRVTKLEYLTKDYEKIKLTVDGLMYWQKYLILGVSILVAIILAMPKIFPDFDPLGIHIKAQHAVEEALSAYELK